MFIKKKIIILFLFFCYFFQLNALNEIQKRIVALKIATKLTNEEKRIYTSLSKNISDPNYIYSFRLYLENRYHKTIENLCNDPNFFLDNQDLTNALSLRPLFIFLELNGISCYEINLIKRSINIEITSPSYLLGPIQYTQIIDSPLFNAIKNNDIQMLLFLIFFGGDINLSKNHFYKETLLHFAVGSYNSEAVDLLLELGANKEAIDSWRRTPFEYAQDVQKTIWDKFFLTIPPTPEIISRLEAINKTIELFQQH